MRKRQIHKAKYSVNHDNLKQGYNHPQTEGRCNGLGQLGLGHRVSVTRKKWALGDRIRPPNFIAYPPSVGWTIYGHTIYWHHLMYKKNTQLMISKWSCNNYWELEKTHRKITKKVSSVHSYHLNVYTSDYQPLILGMILQVSWGHHQNWPSCHGSRLGKFLLRALWKLLLYVLI